MQITDSLLLIRNEVKGSEGGGEMAEKEDEEKGEGLAGGVGGQECVGRGVGTRRGVRRCGGKEPAAAISDVLVRRTRRGAHGFWREEA